MKFTEEHDAILRRNGFSRTGRVLQWYEDSGGMYLPRWKRINKYWTWEQVIEWIVTMKMNSMKETS